jgi:drug/metabolite transporter (DMT)-like permease
MWRIWVAALFWGLNWPVVKIVLDHAGPWTLRAAGLTGGAAMLLAYAWLSRTSLRVPREHWSTLALGGLTGVAGFNVFAVFAQLSMPTSRAAILTFTMPLWVALLSWLFLSEALDRLRLVALTFGAFGLVLLSVPFWPVVQSGGVPFGLIYVLGAAISWAIGTVLLKRWPVTAEPLAISTWQVVVAAIMCTGGMLMFEVPHLDLSQTRAALAFAYHIALPQAAANALWFSLVGRVPASTAALGTLLIPIFGVLGAIALLGDWPTPLDVAGLLLILFGVAVDQSIRAWRSPAPQA